MNERSEDSSHDTNITPEMRMLFTALGVDNTKCYECGRADSVDNLVWDNSCMWFVCAACFKPVAAEE
jgi:hypothetical protein